MATIYELPSREDPYFQGALDALESGYTLANMPYSLSLAGDLSLLGETRIPYLALSMGHGYVHLAVVNGEIVTREQYAGLDLARNLNRKFRTCLSNYIPVYKELGTKGYGLEPEDLDRYVIELLAVKKEHQRKGIAGKPIRLCLDAAKAEPRQEATKAVETYLIFSSCDFTNHKE
ncbi:hypothetical protein M422DRAFT_49415 [Sphaerobolus stellatus SS14]|uniref:Unplaced genomic scaffold SPHSTscaffold_73, whole genome shotgun sequence n=1 Tax=Sphaerobolus stellatus (strain SS14) TaxID=990650 RepID=A0A0C9VPZ3_SPHS4|nr:hypothetical protein M422DRAFT_49415 [Sphaerobolus stellatus SS14]